MSEMTRKPSVKDYPEHLNPFDENYNGLVEPTNSKHKYNTWSASRPGKLTAVAKQKPTFLEKPWTALNISPKGKIGRRLSILKTAVERFASKKKRLQHSASDGTLPMRSYSLNEDYSFRIISPKLKERIRQQAFSKSINKQEQTKTESAENCSSAQLNDRLSLPLKPEADVSLKADELSPTTPEPGKDASLLGARPKTRKKRPPPPPPTETPKSANLELENSQDKTEDSHSANSSITQDLEKDASSADENSLTELDDQNAKTEQKQ